MAVLSEKRKHGKLGVVALLALTIVLGGQQACRADAYFDEGVKRYSKKDWRTAAAYFEQSITNAPWDSGPFYYAALCYQQMGNWDKAKEKYALIVDRFPGTQACINSTAVLKKLDPNFFSRQKTTDSGSSTAAATTTVASAADPMAGVEFSGPQQSRMAFAKVGDKMVLDGSVNGRAVKWYFGGGGDTTTIPKKDWIAMGNRAPAGEGVREAGQTTPSWKVVGTVKVGEVTAKNMPISIQENIDHPSVGEKFFKDFTYTLDQGANQIKLVRKGGGGGSGYELPFKKEGDKMMVTVSVNGRNCTMAFDTGGETVIPKKRAREFGIDVQEESTMAGYNNFNNPNAPQRGEAGFGDMKHEVFGEITVRMGPIDKKGIRAKLDDNAQMPKLSASTFSDWQYSIDQSAKVIRFHR
jgi:hypothetical protein